MLMNMTIVIADAEANDRIDADAAVAGDDDSDNHLHVIYSHLSMQYLSLVQSQHCCSAKVEICQFCRISSLTGSVAKALCMCV